VRIESGVSHCADSDAIRFVFVAASEVDLLLRGGALRDNDTGLRGITVSRGNPRQDSAQHECRRQDALALAGMDRSRDMALRNVRNLMREDAGELVFVAGGVEEARVDADVASGECEGIDVGIVDDEERKFLAAVVRLCRNPAADFIDVLGNHGVFDHKVRQAELCHDGPPDLRFVRFGQDRISGTAHVRQFDIARVDAAHEE
jgi:hypothetical protein